MTVTDTFDFGAATTPDHTDVNRYTLGMPWESDALSVATGNTWLCPTTAPTEQCRMAMFRVADSVMVAFSDLFTPTTGAYNTVPFFAPVMVAADTQYMAAVVTKRYCYTSPGAWPYTSTEGHLSTLASTGGRFETTTGDPVFPDGTTGANYHISPVVTFDVYDMFDFGTPGQLDQSDGGATYALGGAWTSDVDCEVIGNKWRCPTNGPSGQQKMALYRVSDQTLLAESLLFTPVTGVYNDILFTTPAAIVAGVEYVSVVVTNRYAYTSPGGWPHTSVEGHLTTPSSLGGRFVTTTAGTSAYPSGTSAANYHIGPIVRLVDAAATVTITPATSTGAAVAVDPDAPVAQAGLTPAETTVSAPPVGTGADPAQAELSPATTTGEAVAVDPDTTPAQAGLTPAEFTTAAPPVGAAANTVQVELSPAATTGEATAVDPETTPAQAGLTPAGTTAQAVPVDPHGQGPVDLTPASTTITAPEITQDHQEQEPPEMAVSPQTVTLVANTVATLEFDDDFPEMEIVNVTGAGIVYFRFGTTAPVIGAAGCHVLRAEKGAVIRKPKTSGPTVVKFISTGTDTVHARGITE